MAEFWRSFTHNPQKLTADRRSLYLWLCGGDRTMGKSIGKSGDGGIDGIINEDPWAGRGVYSGQTYGIDNKIAPSSGLFAPDGQCIQSVFSPPLTFRKRRVIIGQGTALSADHPRLARR
ncbi:MAG: hypothetical protein U5N55_00085 [Cypionkella sp.]|nr:hypothetical protein [Cypionkella sp.]